MTRTEELLADLTVAEKADLIRGMGVWTSHPIERAGIPQIVVTDGPNGARGSGLFATGTETACIPAGSVLGATWDPHLVERLGVLLGEESRAKGANVLLAPTINLHRNPLGGRNFECYSEDPLLTGRLAAAFVRGVQSQQVATTPKHFVGNDSEFERNTIDVQVDERTLREVYLAPFEHAIVDGGAWGLMSAYNRLNGTFCSEHEWLLTSVLRDDWGFDGFIVSDWFATRSAAASLRAGLTWEMPGPGLFYTAENVQAALDAGDIDEAHLDAAARDMLLAIERTGGFDGLGGGEEKPLDRPEDRMLVREAAIAGTVLVKNDSVLPLDDASLGSIAVIGPNSKMARIGGGGSAAVRPYRETSPLDALTDRIGANTDIRWAQGADINRAIPALGETADVTLVGPLVLELFDGKHVGAIADDAAVLHTATSDTAALLFFGRPAPEVSSKAYTARLRGHFTAAATGTHRVALMQSGRTRVLIDGEVVIDATEGTYERGDSFFGLGTAEITVDIELTEGAEVPIVVEYDNTDAELLCGASVGIAPTAERDLVGEAVELAASCDAAIVVVGTNENWETEGRDRDYFALPGDQPELIRRVAAANSKTVVVVNAGGPHAMDWLDAPAAVLNVGFAGQELGDALVDVLLGEADPGGRMPTTIPEREEHSPAYLNYPGENSVVRYGEGLHIGHRFFDTRHIAPAVAFGHGLSYATFDWGEGRAPQQQATDFSAGTVTVDVDVTNTSSRAGSEVVQVYVEPPPSLVHRPLRELKGFAKLTLEPGEQGTAQIELDRRAFAYFDPGDQVFDALGDVGPVPAGESPRHTEPGWYVEPGVYRLVLARSAVDIVESLDIELTGDELRFNA